MLNVFIYYLLKNNKNGVNDRSREFFKQFDLRYCVVALKILNNTPSPGLGSKRESKVEEAA